MNAVWKAFGDAGVLYPRPEDRPPRPVAEDTLGEQFDEASTTYKSLSDEQQKLSSQNWSEGPRLVRGVAGSGKTIVLANNLARRLQRQQANSVLFEDRSVRILAVCNNRSLVPFLKRKIESAYRQRTGQPLPDDTVDIFYFNGLMYHLSRKGLWRYQRIQDRTRTTEDCNEAKQVHADEERTRQYLRGE
ncbi:MAG: UvrD-helicase domain-containing protein [Planctomycetota bacterium]